MPDDENKFSLSAVSFIEGLLTTFVVGLGLWVWDTNSQMAVMQGELSAVQAQTSTVAQHEVEIEVLKTELRYIREGIDEMSTILKAKE